MTLFCLRNVEVVNRPEKCNRVTDPTVQKDKNGVVKSFTVKSYTKLYTVPFYTKVYDESFSY